MSRDQFIEMVQYMIDTYGVRSYLDNLGDEDEDEMDEDDLWFECPECGDPVLWADWMDSEEFASGYCPICGERLVMEDD